MKNTLTIQRRSTLFLRAVVVMLGLIVFTVCGWVLPRTMFSEEVGYYAPVVAVLYVTAIPFFFAVFQTLRLLGYIDQNKAFSQLSVTALKYIAYSANSISCVYLVGVPFIYYAADRDDAPGVLAISLVILFASLAISVFATVLQKLLQSAIDIKAEHDLTV